MHSSRSFPRFKGGCVLQRRVIRVMNKARAAREKSYVFLNKKKLAIASFSHDDQILLSFVNILKGHS